MILCAYCGMRADIDPEFHEERYGHLPLLYLAEYRCNQCGRAMNIVDYMVGRTCLQCCKSNHQNVNR